MEQKTEIENQRTKIESWCFEGEKNLILEKNFWKEWFLKKRSMNNNIMKSDIAKK